MKCYCLHTRKSTKTKCQDCALNSGQRQRPAARSRTELMARSQAMVPHTREKGNERLN